MSLKYIKAKREDADLLIEIYNQSFYEDYTKYGECPAYGKSKESMEASIEKSPKFIIYNDDIPVGAVSILDRGEGEYYLGCLCVVPDYQNRGIGQHAINYVLDYYSDWKKVTLITPADKDKNISFYTKKCGFKIDGTEMDGNVKVVHLIMERNELLCKDKVSFKLLIEGAFTVEGRGVVACGRVSLGEISPGNDICIVDETGIIKIHARVSEIDYGFISKSPIPKSAIEGWNVGLLFTEVTLEEISIGNYIVIEK